MTMHERKKVLEQSFWGENSIILNKIPNFCYTSFKNYFAFQNFNLVYAFMLNWSICMKIGIAVPVRMQYGRVLKQEVII